MTADQKESHSETPAVPAPPPSPQMSARERMAAAQAELAAQRSREAAEFRAEVERISRARGFILTAEPRIRSENGLFTLAAELVILERPTNDGEGDGL